MGLSIKWDITYKCNLFCKHCINGDLLNNKSEELRTEEVYSIIDNISNSVEIDYIHFLGGEPTVRSDLSKIFTYLSEKNINFGFNTNCINFNSEKYKDILLNKNFKYIVVSLEGPNAEINDLIRGKNVFKKILINLKDIIQFKKNNNLDFKIRVNTVISRTNYNYILEMIDFCVSLGVDELDLLELIIQGNAQNLDISINEEEEVRLVEGIAIKNQEVKDKLRINPKFARPMAKEYAEQVLGLEFPDVYHHCSAGMNFAFINNLGYLYPCDRYLSKELEGKNIEDYNLKDKKFFEVWGEKDFDIPFKSLENIEYENQYNPCNRCKYFKKSCFPCFLVFNDLEKKHNISGCNKYFKLIDEKKKGTL